MRPLLIGFSCWTVAGLITGCEHTGTMGAATAAASGSVAGSSGTGRTGGTSGTLGSSTSITGSTIGGSSSGFGTSRSIGTSGGTTGIARSGPFENGCFNDAGNVGPYIGCDAGPHFEPNVDIDAGCTVATPAYDSILDLCVQCLSDLDCPPDAYCDTSYTPFALHETCLFPPCDGGLCAHGSDGGNDGGPCDATHRCIDNQVCSPAGSCIVACQVLNGADSCAHPDAGLLYCNTFTGLCQQCLNDLDCDVLGPSSTCDAGFCQAN